MLSEIPTAITNTMVRLSPKGLMPEEEFSNQMTDTYIVSSARQHEAKAANVHD
jgi:hypothetical protein